jgi:hypothetical protein
VRREAKSLAHIDLVVARELDVLALRSRLPDEAAEEVLAISDLLPDERVSARLGEAVPDAADTRTRRNPRVSAEGGRVSEVL